MTTARRPLVGFYGDDFTGSTDAMEALAAQDMDVLLFLRTPTDAQSALAREQYAAVGIAGVSRSQGVDWMDAQLPAPFAQLRAMRPLVAHYKVCSTFDSSAAIGNIGRAIEIGRSVFGSRTATPIVVGAPALGRHTAFGHLFARAGDNYYRIDRHPTMSRHPVTPMLESDLLLHLAQQTKLRGRLHHFVDQRLPDAQQRFDDALAGSEMLLLDVLDEASQEYAGERLWEAARRQEEPLFCVGSSGVEYALVAHWRHTGFLTVRPRRWEQVPVDHIAVVSGSCSPVTAKQIDCAEADGFLCLRADATLLVGSATAAEAELARLQVAALEALGRGRSVLVFTARGPQDPAIAQLNAFVREQRLDPVAAMSQVGDALGKLLRELIGAAGLRRVAVAGGDTSGQVVQALGLSALRMRATLTPGAPLCDGVREVDQRPVIEIALKGGQMGSDRYFAAVRAGGPLT